MMIIPKMKLSGRVSLTFTQGPGGLFTIIVIIFHFCDDFQRGIYHFVMIILKMKLSGRVSLTFALGGTELTSGLRDGGRSDSSRFAIIFQQNHHHRHHRGCHHLHNVYHEQVMCNMTLGLSFKLKGEIQEQIVIAEII